MPSGDGMTFNGLLGGHLGAWLLERLASPPPPGLLAVLDGVDPGPALDLEAEFGHDFRGAVKGKTVLDYGCGYGRGVMTLAGMDVKQALGLDIREAVLNAARGLAADEHVTDRCRFLNGHDRDALVAWSGRIDVVLSRDAFEHYPDPTAVLEQMWDLLIPGGSVFVSFGPPWWHPYGCHMMFMGAPPWAHLWFTEQTIMEMRRRYRSDGATRFEEVEGGLNRMTIARFEDLVRRSRFVVRDLRLIPIRKTRLLCRNKIGREFFTSLVKAHLVKPLTYE
jgi:SAM-dependent methyltransferase